MPSTLALLLALPLSLQSAEEGVPLFASDEPLEVTFIADLEAMRRDRSEDPEDRPALMVVHGDTLAVEMRARGNFRRDPANCSFPPLRLDVKRRPAEGTVFEGQDKLKMVVPCRPEQSAYEQYVLLEYGIYRTYRLFTDASFQVRLARLTFHDTGGGRDDFTAWGFLIEEDEVVAERMGGTLVDLPEGSGVPAGILHPWHATLNAVFQFMVGNSDWSDQALHNVKLVDTGGLVVPVPYDFDFSGLVDTPYAVPDPRLGIRDVRERIYRGWCFAGGDRGDLLTRFRDARDPVRAVFDDIPGLDDDRRNRALAYLDAFYEDITTPERAERRMFRDCRAVS